MTQKPAFVSEDTVPNGWERFSGWMGLAGCALLFLGVPLCGSLMLFDILVPLMLWQIWRCRRVLWHQMTDWRHPLFWASLAVAWVLLSSAVQLSRGASPIYNCAIFAYMLLIAAFYCVTPLPSARQCATAAALLLALCLAGLFVGGHCGDAIAARLFYSEANLVGADGGALACRYQFLFNNPNLLGSAYILPYALALPLVLKRLEDGATWRRWLALAALLLLGALPLLHSMSKHLVMTFGLCCGMLSCWPPVHKFAKWVAPTLTAAVGLLFALTVWFRTYPAVKESPWVDFQARSNYSTHQEVYLDIIRGGGVSGLLCGYGLDELHRLYPEYADGAKIAAILEAYYGHKLDDMFVSFMDPHNEYLNSASLFGIPALALLCAAVVCLACGAVKGGFIPGVCFCVALAFACLWDDLSSKRWIWICAAIMARRMTMSPCSRQSK